MRVVLGSIELRSSEKPEFVQHGGEMLLTANTYPGGNVAIQSFGPLYRDISWDGWFEGTDAMERMYQIGNMRQKGQPILFVTEGYTSSVVIAKFHADHRTNFYIPFSITLKRIIQLTKEVQKEAVDQAAEKMSTEEKAPLEKLFEEVFASDTETYRVQKKDTLSKIAKRVYGDANAWDKIYQANRDKLTKGAHLIYEGQELVLP